ncbi:hypothetical protein [Methanobacterium subterraneum]|nr:hypothetical protein [Methanobacterium subterraneum]
MNPKINKWAEKFGEEYTKRNMFTPIELNQLYSQRYPDPRSWI